jgi:hypothetical protein
MLPLVQVPRPIKQAMHRAQLNQTVNRQEDLDTILGRINHAFSNIEKDSSELHMRRDFDEYQGTFGREMESELVFAQREE